MVDCQIMNLAWSWTSHQISSLVVRYQSLQYDLIQNSNVLGTRRQVFDFFILYLLDHRVENPFQWFLDAFTQLRIAVCPNIVIKNDSKGCCLDSDPKCKAYKGGRSLAHCQFKLLFI